MATTNQNNRSVQINTPFGADKVVLTRLTGTEEVSRPFRFELELLSEDASLAADTILGKPVTVTLVTDGQGSKRYFNGVATEFAQTGHDGRQYEYRAVLRPWLWLLSHRVDCRVLQKKSLPDIFAEVCQGFDAHKQNFVSTYDPWDYRVQYRESDFDFLSRLLEHEGVFYYFEHLQDRHVLVLADDVGKSDSCGAVAYRPDAQSGVGQLRSWSYGKSFQPGAFASGEYNFEAPSAAAQGSSSVQSRADASQFEVFDFPAGANQLNSAGVERITKLRAQELQASQGLARGEGDAPALAPGYLFSLQQHPCSDYNKSWLVTKAQYELSSDSLTTGARADAADGVQFSVAIEAVDAQEPYRPRRVTPKPRIQGTQTALVVGPSQKEIWTDKYGRVQVQFHWDRAGTFDENSSCWIRVAQPWAGSAWGAISIPRVGQEVVVSFLDGDPDQPLVIGSVYNADQMPPYALPGSQTQSGVKSRSSEQGAASDFNELRFEDKKGQEEIYLHAEKNLTVVVENNQTITVGKEKQDKGDRSAQIQNDDTLQVGNDLQTTVTGKETRKVDGDRATKVGNNDQLDVSQQYKLTAGDSITLTASNSITLEVGLAKIVMQSDGTLEISGKTVKISGTASAELDSTQTTVSGTQLDLKGTKTTVNGSATLDLTASGVASLKGSLTQIG